MGKIRRLVLDVLKPHNPSIIHLADDLSELEGVEAVNVSIYEMDQRVRMPDHPGRSEPGL